MARMHPPVASELTHDGSVLTLRFHHAKGNIITAEIVAALRTALAASRSPQLRLILLEGEGHDFSFGASVPEHAPGEIDRVLPAFHRLIVEMVSAPAATGALVRGRCLGGGFELTLACDFIFAADDSELGLPEISLGVFPPAASVLLPLRVGHARAVSAVLRGDARGAPEWRDAGLIELVAPAAALRAKVVEWYARHLAPNSPAAIRYASAALRRALRHQLASALPEIERLYLSDLMRSHDAVEGIAAFTEKRAPRWTGQ
jgi:cyclohexa-1,5-dienecarbonyl-CoA hydratase